MTSTSNTPDPNTIETAEREARAYAAWLAAHGYHEASVHRFSTTLNNYGPGDRRTETAVGYAVRYAGTLTRDDGSRAEYPTAGITVFCQDSQLPAGDLATGTRVRALSGPFAGLKGTVKHPDFRAPMIDFDAARGRYARQVQRSDLEPGDACTDGHPLRWNADDYDTPRWVHVSVADLAACTSVMAADEADPCDIADHMNGNFTPGSDN